MWYRHSIMYNGNFLEDYSSPCSTYDWLKKHFGKNSKARWDWGYDGSGNRIFYFKNEEDMTLFLLTWK